MTELVLELVPVYGLYIVFGVVLLACLAVPVPASLLTLTAGGFVAAGEFSFSVVFWVAFAAFVLGDQCAFILARFLGRPVIQKLRTRKSAAKVVEKAKPYWKSAAVLLFCLATQF